MSILDSLEARMENATQAFCRTDRVETGETGKLPEVPTSAYEDLDERVDSADDRMEQATMQFCKSPAVETEES